MTVLDAQAIIAALRGEPAMARVGELLHGSDGPPMLPAVGLAEVTDVLVRTGPSRVEACDEAIDLLRAGGLEIVPVDDRIGRLAGILRSRHWDRDTRPVSMADCVALATAMVASVPLATADAALIAAADDEGHPVIALPSNG